MLHVFILIDLKTSANKSEGSVFVDSREKVAFTLKNVPFPDTYFNFLVAASCGPRLENNGNHPV